MTHWCISFRVTSVICQKTVPFKVIPTRTLTNSIFTLLSKLLVPMSMEQSPYWGAKSFNYLNNLPPSTEPKVHHAVHKTPPVVRIYNHRDTQAICCRSIIVFFSHLTPKYQPSWLQQKHFWLIPGRCKVWVLATTLTILILLWFYYGHSGSNWDSTLNYVTPTAFHITMKALLSNYTSHWCCTALFLNLWTTYPTWFTELFWVGRLTISRIYLSLTHTILISVLKAVNFLMWTLHYNITIL